MKSKKYYNTNKKNPYICIPKIKKSDITRENIEYPINYLYPTIEKF